MKLSLIVTSFLASLAVGAPTELVPASYDEKALEKRVLDPLSIAIIAGVVSGAVSASASVALTKMIPVIGDIADWDDAREQFTQATVEDMIKSAKSNEAAVCCNVGYSVSDKSKVRELASVDFKSGPLKTDYDCFYYSGKTFQLEGDGGFINIAVQPGPCKYNAGTLTCP